LIAVSVVVMAACGDDEDSADTTAAPAATETPAATVAPTATEAAGGANEELCALASETATQEDFPSAEQLTQYKELAPDEILGAVDTAAGALIPAAGDTVAFFNAYAQDDVTAAIEDINDWEAENCGIDHSEDNGPGQAEGVSFEIDDDATRVDVTSKDFEFVLPTDTLTAGRTSLVLTNQGQEAHFMSIVKFAEGATLDEFMSSDGEGGEAFWDSGLAAAGGDDEEALTIELEPGNYAMMCWVAGADATPHAMLGMTKEFTVS
jgi:plastocyanin